MSVVVAGSQMHSSVLPKRVCLPLEAARALSPLTPQAAVEAGAAVGFIGARAVLAHTGCTAVRMLAYHQMLRSGGQYQVAQGIHMRSTAVPQAAVRRSGSCAAHLPAISQSRTWRAAEAQELGGVCPKALGLRVSQHAVALPRLVHNLPCCGRGRSALMCVGRHPTGELHSWLEVALRCFCGTPLASAAPCTQRHSAVPLQGSAMATAAGPGLPPGCLCLARVRQQTRSVD